MNNNVPIHTLKMKYGDEKVMVSPFISKDIIPDKFSPQNVKKAFATEKKFVFRYDAEYNESLTQIIPYILVAKISKGDIKIYVTERVGGEERLKSSLSLGAGGHINPIDNISGYPILTGAIRELNEELKINPTIPDLTPIGTVRDLESNTPEHLGIVYITIVKSASIKEKDKLKGRWMNYKDLIVNYEKFESWARIIIDWIFCNGKTIESLFRQSKKGAILS